MKHTIITCDLCNRRIYKDGWEIEDGAVKIRVKALEMMQQGLTKNLEPVMYPGWKRKVLYICPKCVEKLIGLCKEENA